MESGLRSLFLESVSYVRASARRFIALFSRIAYPRLIVIN